MWRMDWKWCGDSGSGEVIMATVQVRVDSGLDQSHGIIDGGKGNTIRDRWMKVAYGAE